MHAAYIYSNVHKWPIVFTFIGPYSLTFTISFSLGDTLSNATSGKITPTATSSCACSHDVSEVTRLSTVYINVCSKVDTTVPHQPRQPPILTTATYTKSDSTSTVSTVISTMSHQGSTASLDSTISTQPKPTTHSLHNLQPTPVPSLENTIGDPHHTGSPETESVERGETYE